MEIITLTDKKTFASNCYILLSETTFSVVDPSVSYEEAKMAIPKLSELRAEYIMLTHGHIDHIWHIDSYVKAGGRVLVSSADAALAKDRMLNCAFMLKGNISEYCGDYKEIQDGEHINVAGCDFVVMETPGHTGGSVCYLSDGVVFTGDTLFANGSYGRYDLPTGDLSKLRQSLKKLLSLNEDLVVYSGHGEITTLKDTKAFFI